MTAYYNEIDPYAAEWLRRLIAAGHIAPGVVDTRSITELDPNELRTYTQCHFFAGIGVWSHSLRAAGWDDARPVWTGSCPCQPFSSAGKRLGTADERHLWPAFARLIAECKPATVFGEQVASGAGRQWLASVRDDLEALGYAVGAADLCAAGVGAPHIRQRLYWVADAGCQLQAQHGGAAQQCDRLGAPSGDSRRSRLGGLADAAGQQEHQEQQGSATHEGRRSADGVGRCSVAGGLADANGGRQQGNGQQHGGTQRPEQQAPQRLDAGGRGEGGGVADSGLPQRETDGISSRVDPQHDSARNVGSHGEVDGRGRAGAVDSYWRAADWLWCRDGRWRPVRSGTFPLATGAPARVGRLRAYGNALCAPVATAFVEAFLKCKP